jgi:hypothetical protein
LPAACRCRLVVRRLAARDAGLGRRHLDPRTFDGSRIGADHAAHDDVRGGPDLRLGGDGAGEQADSESDVSKHDEEVKGCGMDGAAACADAPGVAVTHE